MRAILIIAAITLLSLGSSSASSQSSGGEAWKTNWDAYVDEVIRCMGDSSCHLGPRFGGTVVTWEGTLDAMGSQKNERGAEFVADEYPEGAAIKVRIRLTPRVIPIPGTGVESKTPEFFIIKIKEGSLERWKTVRMGTRLQFHLTLDSFGQDVGGLGRYGLSIAYSMSDAEPVVH